jgi:acid phosphatase type 7
VRPTAVIRLAIAVVLAAAGAVVLLAGLGSLASRWSSSGPPADAGANAIATVGPSLPAASTIPASGSPPAESPAASGDPVLVGAGDIALCDGTDDEATAAMIERMPGIVFALGDNAYDRGSARDYQDCFGPSWGQFKDRIAFPVPGNHEYKTAGATGYRDYFGTMAVRDGTTWYSRDVGAWHVIVLDSTCDRVDGGCGPDSPQLQWLRDDLAASDAKCTLALWHHPRFSSGDHGNDEAVGPFWDALYAAGADLVLNGHDHDYERFAPQDPQGNANPTGGLTEIVVGTGGAELREFKDPRPNSVVRSSAAHGVLSLTLGQGGWTYRFDSTDGMFTDQGGGTCH